VITEETYRQKAAELRQHARAERNVSSRLEWELLALGYDRLADQARRNAQYYIEIRLARSKRTSRSHRGSHTDR
jgi:hypothetical protein